VCIYYLLYTLFYFLEERLNSLSTEVDMTCFLYRISSSRCTVLLGDSPCHSMRYPSDSKEVQHGHCDDNTGNLEATALSKHGL
jgi:hypothetical protein